MLPPFKFTVDELSTEELAAEAEVFGGLATSVRALMQASLRTTVEPAEIDAVRRDIDALTERLMASHYEGAYGMRMSANGDVRNHGNAVVGLRNPIALPITTAWGEDGHVRAEFELNALYEGPPGKAHGGVTALILDQICGEASAAGGVPGMTGTLSLRYRKVTPLGKITAEAWVDRSEGIKTTVLGELRDEEGDVCVEATGLFILPRWAREAMANDEVIPRVFE